VYALFPHRAALPVRTRALLDFLAEALPASVPQPTAA
jgi:hypothetical protein